MLCRKNKPHTHLYEVLTDAPIISVHPGRSFALFLMFIIYCFRLTIIGWIASVYSQLVAIFNTKRFFSHKILERKKPANTDVYRLSSTPRVGLEPTTTRLTAERSTD